MPAFDTLLVANRGEIACRVIRSARAMGLRTVAVYSEADLGARHVALADVAVPIGPAPARDSYLRIDRILDACRQSGAQAIHPGYGFLSESAAFSLACRQAGFSFVGPSPEAIEALGNKSAAKTLAQRIGVPCLPGYAGADQSDDTLIKHAARIGAPLMIKAAAGGGGRGMRRCDDVGDAAALRVLLEAARLEAQAAFGSGELLLERLVEHARHVEVQIFGDAHGNYLHLGERDCSTQRRNQKILEEAPAPGFTPQQRAAIGEAAIQLAREVGYMGAGTVEFLLSADGSFHFLEMNTRLQVEHPVTEAICGLDLVEWQLRIARGEPLPLTQQQIELRGHAIEARLCAEDPWQGFAPQAGPVTAWQMPQGEGIRVDHGLATTAVVPTHYDSMIAKIIAFGADREQARTRLISALERTSLLGIRNNRDYLLRCLRAPQFSEPDLSTAWLANASQSWLAPQVDSRWLAVAGALLIRHSGARHGPLSGWSSSGPRAVPLTLAVSDQEHRLELRCIAPDSFEVTGPDWMHRVACFGSERIEHTIDVDGLRRPVRAHVEARGGALDAFGLSECFTDATHRLRQRDDAVGSGRVLAKMHGQVVDIAVATGDKVRRGQRLLSIEAMKMEHQIHATIDGIVIELGVTAGQQIAPGRLLVSLEPIAVQEA
jgi:geranyl-CoA carboxylase alpha subunit